MFDDDLNSPCEGEESVYRQFTQQLNETFRNSEGKSFRDILGDALDYMLGDDEPAGK